MFGASMSQGEGGSSATDWNAPSPGGLTHAIMRVAEQRPDPNSYRLSIQRLLTGTSADDVVSIVCELATKAAKNADRTDPLAADPSPLRDDSTPSHPLVPIPPASPQSTSSAHHRHSHDPSLVRAMRTSSMSMPEFPAPANLRGSWVPSTPHDASPTGKMTPAGHGRGSTDNDTSTWDDSCTTLNHSAVVVTRGDTLDSVNDLEFVRPIGHGAQATVWLCVDVNTGEERAVKVIDRSHCGVSDADGASLMEIEAAKRLRHDNVIRLYEVIDDPSARAVFLVMEYVEHGHSGAVHAESGVCVTALTMSQIAQLAVGAAQGLHYCHARGVLHGDIKPENFLIDRQPGDTLRCVVADFGVSKLCAPQEFDPDAPLGDAMAADEEMLESGELDAVLEAFDARRRGAAALAASVKSSFPISCAPDPATASSPGAASASSELLRHTTPPLQAYQPVCGEGDSASPASCPPRIGGGSSAPPAEVRPWTPTISVVVSGGAATSYGAASWRGARPDMGASLSLRDVSSMLANKTRGLQRNTTSDLQAKLADRNAIKMVGGTPAFQAPELFEGRQPTPASDMWALGVTLYALIFKRLPWHGATWSELKAAVCGTALTFPVETVCDREQRRWRAIIERLLHKDPAVRMTAAEMCRASQAATRPSAPH